MGLSDCLYCKWTYCVFYSIKKWA